LPDPANPARALLHQPLAPGPCTREFGGFGGGPRKRPKKGDFREFPHFRGKWPFPGPGGSWRPGLPGRPQTGDRAPARGVDVKPPSPGWLGSGCRAAGAPWPVWDPETGSGDLPEAPPGPSRGRCPVPDPGAGVVLHQPLAAGPCPRPGDPLRGPEAGRPSRAPGGSPPPRTGAEGPVGVTGAGRPQGAH